MPSNSSRAIIVFKIVGSIYLCLIAIVFVSNIENTTFRRPNKLADLIRFLLPEKWNFFTKDPRSERIGFYSKDRQGNYVVPDLFPSSNATNLFGLKRNTRAAGAELGYFTENYISRENWTPFAGGSSILSFASKDTFPIYRIKNPFRQPQLCGEYLITIQSPVPWAWKNSDEQVNMPGSFIKVILVCDQR